MDDDERTELPVSRSLVTEVRDRLRRIWSGRNPATGT